MKISMRVLTVAVVTLLYPWATAVAAPKGGLLEVSGVFLGCAIGQGIMGCGVRGDDGKDYHFDDQSTPPMVFNSIGDDWNNKRVTLSGVAQNTGETSVDLILTGIAILAPASPAAAPPIPPPPSEPYPGTSLVQRLLGTWQSTEDLHYSREFRPDGIQVESYEGTEENSRYGLFGDCDAPLDRPDPNGTHLKIWADDDPQFAMCFSIDTLSNDRLTLTYLSGAVSTVNYQRLP